MTLFSLDAYRWAGLGKIVEEASELITIIGKLIATGGKSSYWDGRSLRKDLIDELADTQAAINFVVELHLCPVELNAFNTRTQEKLDTYREWRKNQPKLPEDL